MWATGWTATPYFSLKPPSSIWNRTKVRARDQSGEPPKGYQPIEASPEGLPANWGEPPKGYQPIPGYLLIRDNSEQ